MGLFDALDKALDEHLGNVQHQKGQEDGAHGKPPGTSGDASHPKYREGHEGGQFDHEKNTYGETYARVAKAERDFAHRISEGRSRDSAGSGGGGSSYESSSCGDIVIHKDRTFSVITWSIISLPFVAAFLLMVYIGITEEIEWLQPTYRSQIYGVRNGELLRHEPSEPLTFWEKFILVSPHGLVFCVNLGSGKLTDITEQVAGEKISTIACPVEYPDGTKIGFVTTRRGKDGEIYLVYSNGKDPTWVEVYKAPYERRDEDFLIGSFH